MKGNHQQVETPEFFTVGQLAKLLQVTEMTIYRMIRRGDIACYSIGRVKRFGRKDIEDFLRRCRRSAESEQMAVQSRVRDARGRVRHLSN